MRPHDEFLELCALSTTGELTEEEQGELKEHLTVCSGCREAIKEFEAVVDIGIPQLTSELISRPPAPIGTQIEEPLPAIGPQSTASQVVMAQWSPQVRKVAEGWLPGRDNGHGRTGMNWNYLWLPFAAAVALTVALGIYAYRMGQSNRTDLAEVTRNAAQQKVTSLEQQISDTSYQQELLRSQLAARDHVISGLRRQLEQQSVTLTQMRSAEADLGKSLQADKADNQQEATVSTDLARKLSASQVELDKLRAELSTAQQQRLQAQVQVAGLQSQIDDLSRGLQEREATIERQGAFLAHDKAIRDLMGARDLYIAEVYDVGRDGKTKKPFGRIFYTKSKSLVFYAYDLDQNEKLKRASAFQAWGRRGPDNDEALNLGIFYQDDAAKKRWVLKFDNPKELSEIDAVFVTVEPKGGSPKPSGKPLLFAYLKVNPNHP